MFTKEQIQRMVSDADAAVNDIFYAADVACHVKALACEVVQFATRLAALLPDVELAQLANGGKEFRQDWCQCDTDVGMVPCQYCAIYDALRRTESIALDATTEAA